jgi:hypothetical protein
LKRYRAIPARSVALAIVALLDRAGSGLFVHEHEEMERLAAGGHGAEG